jgi:predicted GIY-YIG superfamily endonuclease
MSVGFTTDLGRRIDEHNRGSCSHTARFRPWRIVYSEQFFNEPDALRRERQIKGWTRAKKEALIAGNVEELRFLAKRRRGG